MNKQPITTSDERKMKFVEAGVLFVLILAITIFVGVRMASHNGQDGVGDVARIAAENERSISEISTRTDDVANSDDTIATDSAEADPDMLNPTAEIEAVEDQNTLAADPPRVVTYAMAEQTYFDGDYAAAAAQFDAYTADHDQNAWGFYMLGLSEWKAGDLDASEEAFIAALELKPDHVKSLVNYSRVLLALERPAAARDQVELALQSTPENVDANRMSSRISYHEGRLDEAADGYLKVLQIKADDVWSLNNLGLIRIEQERFAEALPPLAKAAQLTTQVACIQNNLGVALERTGHYGAAVQAFETALAIDGDYAKADESLDRVSDLTEAADLAAVDLIALAAGFSADPAVATADTAGDEVMDVPGDMDVASSLSTVEAEGDPQSEVPQDRQ